MSEAAEGDGTEAEVPVSTETDGETPRTEETKEGEEPAQPAAEDQAEELLDTEGIPHDGYYAFVCEKCEPTFRYYGYFLYANELKKRAEEIYGRD